MYFCIAYIVLYYSTHKGAYFFRSLFMETRVAVMSIIVENMDSVEPLNALLHGSGKYIIGRMGIPYHKRGISIISIALDAPQNVLSALAGKIGAEYGQTEGRIVFVQP